MNYLMVIAILFLPRLAAAQDENVDPYAECSQIVDGEPFNNFPFLSQEGRYSMFNHDYEAKILLGVKCSAEQIVTFMDSAGWELEKDEPREFENQDFISDRILQFCLPNSFFWRLIAQKCRAKSNVYTYESRITWISTGPTK